MTKDDQIKLSIEEALSNNFRNTALGVNIQVEKGFVTIHGMVDTLWEKEEIVDLVSKLPQVKGVDNGLTVAIDNMREDDEIEELVLKTFSKDPRMDIRKIGAECDKGVVILRGQASSLGEIEVARELAAQVHGVKDVRSLVKISNEAKEIDDASIVNGIEMAFAASEMVEAEDVETSCTKGVVTLIGFVDNNEEKEAAEIIAKTVPGVRKVINKLKTRHENTQGDTYLTNQLRRALNKDPRVSPAQVKGYVVEGTAYLSGKVYTIEGKRAAEEIARNLTGIKQVINDVTVAYH